MTNRADIDATIRRMWGASSQTEIAVAAGVNKSTVGRRAAELGLLVRPEPAAPEPAGLDIDGPIRELWPDHSPGAIAKRLGVLASTVKRRARAIGLPAKVAALAAPLIMKSPAPRIVSGVNLRRKQEARAEDAPRLEFAPLPAARPAGPGALILADAPVWRACRFPVGEAPEGRADLQLFCSAPTAERGCPYCAEHAALAFPNRKRNLRK